MNQISALDLYSANAQGLALRYDSVTTDALLEGLIDLIPPPPAAVLDIGAGSGRDVVWFLERGHRVTASEPVVAFRNMIAARAPGAILSPAMLPDLEGLSGPFDLIVMNAVWHHLAPEARDAALRRLIQLLGEKGRLFLSLRHGPVRPEQSLFTVDTATETARAASVGLSLQRNHTAPAYDVQTAAAGISWTWLALEKETAL